MSAAASAHASRAGAVVAEHPFANVPVDAVIAVAMSGGVDSSAAAALCARSGRRTFGITLAMWPRDRDRDRDRGCCSIDAVEDARRVAATVGIPHYSWNLEADFEREVITDFADEYAAGRTPNPCVRCNERIKFGSLLDGALTAGATHIATGHWARRGRRGTMVTLHRAVNSAKDQAYTLHRLNQDQLRRAVFPLGSLPTKGAVRALAVELGLITAHKPESQELCFVDGNIRDDLGRRLAGRYRPGVMLDAGGKRVGEHRGAPFYTVGQRSGLGLQSRRPDAEPLYVIGIDAVANTVTVGARAALQCQELRLRSCSWTGAPPAPGERLLVQLRSHAAAAMVTVGETDGGATQLTCEEPVTQVAPGQAAVLFAGDEVIGGGVVT